MRLRDEVIGAMNLFSTDTGVLTQSELRVVQSLADTATIGLLQERAIHHGEVLSEQLQGALNTRITIEQAKGALARIHDVSVDEAFEMMRTYARRTARRLGEVADDVVSDRSRVPELVDGPPPPHDPPPSLG